MKQLKVYHGSQMTRFYLHYWTCMYGTEPFVHELSVKLACMWYYILRAHKLAKYSAHNSFM